LPSWVIQVHCNLVFLSLFPSPILPYSLPFLTLSLPTSSLPYSLLPPPLLPHSLPSHLLPSLLPSLLPPLPHSLPFSLPRLTPFTLSFPLPPLSHLLSPSPSSLPSPPSHSLSSFLTPSLASHQMRKTKVASVFPVAFAGGLKYEGPKCVDGKAVDWHVTWDPRRYSLKYLCFSGGYRRVRINPLHI